MTVGTGFTILAYVTAISVLIWQAKRRRLLTEGMGIVFLTGLLAGVVGAKLTQLIYSGDVTNASALLDPRHGGRTIIGALITGWLGVEIAKRVLGIKRSTGDMFALAIPAGEAVGRIGCFLNECCHGIPATVPWAVIQHGAERHPAQLYSSIAAIATFCLLLTFQNRMRREGDLFKLYLVLYGVFRFFIEIVRERESVFAGLSLAQLIALELVAVGFVLLWISWRREVKRLGDVPELS